MKRDSLLHMAALLLILAALFHPAIPMQRELHNVVLVADVTQSMNVEDVVTGKQRISRLTHIRHLMQQAVRQLPCGSRVSIGVFSAEAIALLYRPIEVCANFDVIQDSIAHLEWRMAWRGNSRLRFGLKAAAATLDVLPVPAQLVLFTDGDEAPKLNAVNTLDLSHWQGGLGWVLVGVGGDTPMPIPKYDSENRILGYWATTNMILAPSQVQSEESLGTRDDSIASDDYNRYLSKLEDEYLHDLAQEIGARYVRSDSTPAVLKALREQPSAGKAVQKVPLTRLLLSLALLSLLAVYFDTAIQILKLHLKTRRPYLQ